VHPLLGCDKHSPFKIYPHTSSNSHYKVKERKKEKKGGNEAGKEEGRKEEKNGEKGGQKE
jgi:hypothetical protein